MSETSTDHLAIASSSVLGLKIAFLDKIVIFRPNIELEVIARQSEEASCEVDCAYFGNIGRNSGYFLLPIFLGSYLSEHCILAVVKGWMSSAFQVFSVRQVLGFVLWIMMII